jgi:DNA repair photolyase
MPQVIKCLIFFLVYSNHPVILGDNNRNIPQIVCIFAEVLARNAIDVQSEVGSKIVSFLKSLQVKNSLSTQASY